MILNLFDVVNSHAFTMIICQYFSQNRTIPIYKDCTRGAINQLGDDNASVPIRKIGNEMKCQNRTVIASKHTITT